MAVRDVHALPIVDCAEATNAEFAVRAPVLLRKRASLCEAPGRNVRRRSSDAGAARLARNLLERPVSQSFQVGLDGIAYPSIVDALRPLTSNRSTQRSSAWLSVKAAGRPCVFPPQGPSPAIFARSCCASRRAGQRELGRAADGHAQRSVRARPLSEIRLASRTDAQAETAQRGVEVESLSRRSSGSSAVLQRLRCASLS